MLVVPRRRSRQRIDSLFPHGERQSGFVLESALVFQVGISARQEIEVVERREAVVARYGCFGHDIPLPGKQVIGKEGRNRRPLGPVHLLPHDDRHTQPLRGPPLGRHRSVEFDAAFVVADDTFAALLENDILVRAFYEMLVHGNIGRKEPFISDGIFSVRLPVERIYLAPRTGHGVHYPVAGVPAVVVGHPRMNIPGLCRDFPVAAQVVPREDAAQGVFALAVFEIRIVGVVGGQQCQFPVGIDIPCVQPEAVAASGVVVDFLQDVYIVESTALVALGGIIRPDDIFVLVVDILFFVPVAVLVIVGRGLVNGTGRNLPVPVSVGQAQKFIECLIHADTLNVLEIEPFSVGRLGRKFHQSAQSAARLVHRGCAVQ